MLKKIKFSSVEIMGALGFVIWFATYCLRKSGFTFGPEIKLIISVLPNFACAWIAAMLFKWITEFAFNNPYSFKRHVFICFLVLLAGICSEFVYQIFFNGKVDVDDIMSTVVALVISIIIVKLTYKKSHQ